MDKHIGWRKIFIFSITALMFFSSFPASSVFAKLSEADLYFYGQNNIMFYEAGKNQSCDNKENCFIMGDTPDEVLWSAIRGTGLTPVQTSALIANIIHEGKTPTFQEGAYNIARGGYEYNGQFLRKNWCAMNPGNTPFDIYLDGEDGYTYQACMFNNICPNCGDLYKEGYLVNGIGIGLNQWTYRPERLAYLEKMGEAGLLKYFEGDAYLTYGMYDFKQLRDAVPDSDWKKLWCIAAQFMKTTIDKKLADSPRFKEYFESNEPEKAGGGVAAYYEGCAECGGPGSAQYDIRSADARRYYDRYEKGEFDHIENAIKNGASASSSSTSEKNTGKNVTIIGDSITKGSINELKKVLPDANIYAENSKRFASGTEDNPSGLTIINDLKSSGKLGDIIVYALGTNDSKVTEENVKSVVDAVGAREIFFLTNYDSKNEDKYTYNNNTFEQASVLYDNVKLIDWKNIVKNTDKIDNYIQDETSTEGYAVHPTAQGSELFANTIADAVNKVKTTKVSDVCRKRTNSAPDITEEDANKLWEAFVPWDKANYGDNMQCPQLVEWFLKHTLKDGELEVSTSHGKCTVDAMLRANKEKLTESSEPTPLSIFSTWETGYPDKSSPGVCNTYTNQYTSEQCGYSMLYRCYGHTGIVLKDLGDDTWLTLETDRRVNRRKFTETNGDFNMFYGNEAKFVDISEYLDENKLNNILNGN